MQGGHLPSLTTNYELRITNYLVNPKYYNQMSELLDALIQERREQAISYQEYLEKIKQLAQQVVQPGTQSAYASSLNTAASAIALRQFG